MVAGAMDVRRVVTSEPSHMTSGPTSAELHPVYPSPHAANPGAAAIGSSVSEPQTAFRPVAKRSVVDCNTTLLCPDRREEGNKRCFCPSVRLSVRLSLCLSVCSSVAYIANNSRTQRPSVPKFGMKVPHLRCDSHASFKVKRSKVRVTDGRDIPCRPNPAATLLVHHKHGSKKTKSK